VNEPIQEPPPEEQLVPPHDVGAERAVLGAVLIKPESYVLARSVVGPEHFYDAAHRRVWAAAVRVAKREEAIDLVTLHAELKATNEIDQVGGIGWLGKLSDGAAMASNVEHYARIVRGLAARRRMIAEAREVLARGYDGRVNTEDYLDESRAAMAEAAVAMSADTEATSLSTSAQRLYSVLSSKEPNKDLIPLGLGGVKVAKGEVTVVAGRPSNGKSTFALNAVCNAATGGQRCLVYNLEDTGTVYTARTAARFSKVPVENIIEHDLDLEHWPRLVAACDQMARLPVSVFDKGGVNHGWVRRTAAVHKERHGLDLVVVDYVQLMAGRAESRQEALANNARGLAKVARELHVAMIILSQIRRPDQHYKDKIPPPPRLEDLKGTGVLEEVARCVVLLHWPAFYNAKEEAADHLWCRVAKNANGQPGHRSLSCAMPRMWIGDPGLSAADPSATRY
jgi:replicative DNA helicase